MDQRIAQRQIEEKNKTLASTWANDLNVVSKNLRCILEDVMNISLPATRNFENDVWQVFRAIGTGRRCALVRFSHGGQVSLGNFWYERIRVVAKLVERGLVKEHVNTAIEQTAMSETFFGLTAEGKHLHEELCHLTLEEGGRESVKKFNPHLQ